MKPHFYVLNREVTIHLVREYTGLAILEARQMVYPIGMGFALEMIFVSFSYQSRLYEFVTDKLGHRGHTQFLVDITVDGEEVSASIAISNPLCELTSEWEAMEFYVPWVIMNIVEVTYSDVTSPLAFAFDQRHKFVVRRALRAHRGEFAVSELDQRQLKVYDAIRMRWPTR